ncbi:MAG: ChbG/HpnK family deacetylase [Candidatus Riflebacteria bacterium]|nr:ChbG/HpnK family deacetylase [Candidatus Riflebacteria bacterium]
MAHFDTDPTCGEVPHSRTSSQEKCRRVLIVNADDFGRSENVNAGVIVAHEEGIVTSASLMVRWPAASRAAAYARKRPQLSVGLHVDLAEWVYREGGWSSLYTVAPLEDPGALEVEVARQLAAFRELLGRDPSHLDSHQHLHLSEPLRSVLIGVARDLDVPLRGLDPRVRYRGDFYGQSGKGEPCPGAIGVEALLALLAGLGPGVTELGCHPGLAGECDSVYGTERAIETRTLTDARVRIALEWHGITQWSYHHLSR